MRNAIEIKDLTKRYGKLVALDGVSLSIDKGELFGLLGPDGAGKSTLYKILATLMVPDGGSASVCGLDVVRDYRQIRLKIGYMPEKFSLYQDLTVHENLKFYASLFGTSIKENFDLIAPIFGQLEKFPDRMAGNLSGGMKQKLALSCALIHRPNILLLDEPTTGVDAVSRDEFWQMLGELKDKGITIPVSTSYMDEATRCERLAMINSGRILETGTPQELIAGLNENLYNAVSKDMFKLLIELQKLPEVTNCYTFGATLHVVVNDNFKVDDAIGQLKRNGLRDVKIYPAKGDIEDLFIKLTETSANGKI